MLCAVNVNTVRSTRLWSSSSSSSSSSSLCLSQDHSGGDSGALGIVPRLNPPPFLAPSHPPTPTRTSWNLSQCRCLFGDKLGVNPFTAPACTISGLNDARTRLKKQYIFWSYNTYTFNAMRFDENPLTCQCEKEI